MKNALTARRWRNVERAAAGLALLWAAAEPAHALSVNVTDRNDRPLAGVVVYAVPEAAAPDTAPSPAIMDQIDRQFSPRVLVVQTGTSVTFPNSDSVSHHVYSFSDTKRFELPLYRGTVHAPVVFASPGVVVVGCNIHDSMLGYIVVVDTPYFTFTDAEGNANFSGLPAGDYRVQAWSYRSREQQLSQHARVAPATPQEATLAFQFTGKLFPPHESENRSLAWSDY